MCTQPNRLMKFYSVFSNLVKLHILLDIVTVRNDTSQPWLVGQGFKDWSCGKKAVNLQSNCPGLDLIGHVIDQLL